MKKNFSHSPLQVIKIHKVDDFLKKPVQPFTVSSILSISEMVSRMGETSYQARNLAQGVNIWAQMLEGEKMIFFGLAGAMIPAGMRQVVSYIIENRMIDCLVSTGANLFHDLLESLGKPHWKGNHEINDLSLAKEKINRIYDVLLPDKDFDEVEDFIIDFFGRLPADGAYSTREFFYSLGQELIKLGRGEGIITASVKAGVPIYCPALGDSVYGTALATAKIRKDNKVLFDIGKDVAEMIKLASTLRPTGVIIIGGGTPKNFIQQAVLCTYLYGKESVGHDYAIQITTDSPQWGGLSGCTFEEARSWRKISAKARTVTIYSDATIALPIMVSALAESASSQIKTRKSPTFKLAKDLSLL